MSQSATLEIGSLITSDPRIHRGRPIISGTGVTVARIVGWYQSGLSPDEIADQIRHLSLAQVYAALAHYHANRETMDAEIAATGAEADQIEAANRSKANP